jgi:8-oxo-dGTP diphosphatase
MSIQRITRFRTILTARLLLNYREHYLFLAQTPSNGGGYTFPGGKIEGEEFAREALAREVFEEVGLEITPKSLKLVHITHRKQNSIVEIIFFFTTDTYTGELVVKEPLKFRAAEWLPMDEPPKKLTAVLEHALTRIQEGKFYSEFPKKKKLEFRQILGASVDAPKEVEKVKKAKKKKVSKVEKLPKKGK